MKFCNTIEHLQGISIFFYCVIRPSRTPCSIPQKARIPLARLIERQFTAAGIPPPHAPNCTFFKSSSNFQEVILWNRIPINVFHFYNWKARILSSRLILHNIFFQEIFRDKILQLDSHGCFLSIYVKHGDSLICKW